MVIGSLMLIFGVVCILMVIEIIVKLLAGDLDSSSK